MNKNYRVGAFYFPNYHIDRQNERRHGKGWNEWNVLKYATPRFEGHQQPKVPAWGYEDEADLEVMAKKIDAAAENGVDTFMFDWYYYDSGPYLEKCLEQGFLKAKNVDKMNFSLMWANHDWCNMHPKGLTNPGEIHESGRIKRDTFMKAANHMIENYFCHPSYLRVEGGLFLTIFELAGLIDTFGSIERTKQGLSDLRNMVRDAGLGGLHLNAVVWSNTILPAEQKIENLAGIVQELGFDSATSYVWVHVHEMSNFPATSYAIYRDECIEKFKGIAADYKIPYIPNVTVGWDPSPRTVQSDKYEDAGYPFTPVLVDNTPDEFEIALQKVKDYIDKQDVPKIVTINAWNEWTEGSYLEPDTVYGMEYLKRVKKVFGDK